MELRLPNRGIARLARHPEGRVQPRHQGRRIQHRHPAGKVRRRHPEEQSYLAEVIHLAEVNHLVEVNLLLTGVLQLLLLLGEHPHHQGNRVPAIAVRIEAGVFGSNRV